MLVSSTLIDNFFVVSVVVMLIVIDDLPTLFLPDVIV